jgi:Bax protein
MVNIRSLLLAALVMTLFSGHAIAYQYGYYSPHPYNAPRGYYNPYVRVPYPYYPTFRYPAQPAYEKTPAGLPAVNSSGIRKSDAINHKQGLVEKKTQTTKSVHELSTDKQEFINTLLPYIEQENRRLTKLRESVASLLDKLDGNVAISPSERQKINKLARKYRLEGSPLESIQARAELLRKIDIIPASLALAQAANESAWGKSRFAQQANNLFGIWTYDQDKGLIPLNREEGKTHLVRIFDDYGESVGYYMHTLNSHPAYRELREIRQQLRASGQMIDGHKLAAGLENYSAKGEAYINLIRSLIRQNQWAQLDTGKQRA